METTKVSTKGQVVLPKAVRAAQRWEPGQELEVINAGGYVILKKAAAKRARGIESLVGVLSKYRKDKPVTDEEMQAAVRRAAVERYQRSLKK